jgi:hypothetical protein
MGGSTLTHDLLCLRPEAPDTSMLISSSRVPEARRHHQLTSCESSLELLRPWPHFGGLDVESPHLSRWGPGWGGNALISIHLHFEQ